MRVIDECQQKIELLGILYFEHIVADELVHQIFPQLWGYLQGIYSKTQEDFCYAVGILLEEVFV